MHSYCSLDCLFIPANIESKFVQLGIDVNLLAVTSNIHLETDICSSYVTPAVAAVLE